MSLSILVLNQPWFLDELRALGHRVCFAGFEQCGPDVMLTPGTSWERLKTQLPFVPDRIVYLDNSGPLIISGLEEAECPTVFYSVDAHHHAAWHRFYGKIFDRVLVAQSDYLPSYLSERNDARWFPLWATYAPSLSAERPIEVCFRGTLDPELHPQRAAFFREVATHVPLLAGAGSPKEDYPRAKIVVNQAVKGDLNFRVFEALAGGACLITPHIANGQEALFEVGRELVTYESGNVTDLVEKIRFYLSHPAEREAIASAGYAKVSQEHSAERRAAALERELLSLSRGMRLQHHFASGCAHTSSVDVYHALSEEMAQLFTLRAAEALIKSAEAREREDREFFNTVMVCRFFLERYTLPIAEEFSYRIFCALSHHPWAEGMYLDALLFEGREREVLDFIHERGVQGWAALCQQMLRRARQRALDQRTRMYKTVLEESEYCQLLSVAHPRAEVR
jgi:hypothetical protein